MFELKFLRWFPPSRCWGVEKSGLDGKNEAMHAGKRLEHYSNYVRK